MESLPAYWFKLFASCKIVEGKAASLIYDVERAAFYELPNDFLEIMNLAAVSDVASVKAHYNHEQDEAIESFFNQFVESEMGFYTTEPGCFPDIQFDWEQPYELTNAIIERDRLSVYDLADVINQLNALGCRAVQLRFRDQADIKTLVLAVGYFRDLRIQHLELLLPYDSFLQNEHLFELAIGEERLYRIIVYAAPEECVVPHENTLYSKLLFCLKKDIRIDTREIIEPMRFRTNIELFSEAQHFNTGLNRKVSVSNTGAIQNYPGHETVFGNVTTDKIAAIIKTKAFREKWTITNDQVETCRDCQFRYACVSNSDIATANSKMYKTSMCNFDPSSNTWKPLHVVEDTLIQMNSNSHISNSN
jgi:SPASM domain peptide maturase of grasp-with-spasm system